MSEGSLEAPIRHPIDWKSDFFWDKADLESELERVFDICHAAVYHCVIRFLPCLIWWTNPTPWKSTVSTKLTT